MKILLTGATGYIGRRLLPVLLDAGHHVTCLVRHSRKFDWEGFSKEALQHITVVQADLNEKESLDELSLEVDVAYFLVHAMSSSSPDFEKKETEAAINFVKLVEHSKAKQLIYLSGISNDDTLSPHLRSRKNVEAELKKSKVPLTVLRAAIIIGSGSASFEIIRDLVEKLPIMVTPRWLNTRCQPIAIRNVLQYLYGIMLSSKTYNQTYDIGGTEILTYKEMLLDYAKVRGLTRSIITLPVLTPRLSSLWLALVTSTSYPLARTLVDSMKNEVICHNDAIKQVITIKLFDYKEALRLAFDKISHNNIISHWTDSLYSHVYSDDALENIRVPAHGVFTDERHVKFTRDKNEVIDNLWAIGGSKGYYFGNWMWKTRGLMDKLVGGVGLRRGRRSDKILKAGDALDFWRVLLADKAKGRLILYAEMKLPGEAWLEFRIDEANGAQSLVQTATFRPLGIWGRLYWYIVWPFHGLLFPKMARNITRR